MKALVSIRLDDELLHEARAKARFLHLSQTNYIRKAIERMNNETEKRERKQRLKRASLRVREGSMKINAEFSGIDYDPEN